MIAKRLESLIADTANCSETEMVQRFQKLRNFNLLPKSRGKNADNLSHDEIVSGILSVVTARLGYAGVTSKFLKDLRPVGGPEASFAKAENFGKAIEALFDDPDSLESLLEIRVSDSEVYTNSHGRAVVVYRCGEKEKVAYYVRREALSLMQPGSEKSYKPRELISALITETVFFPGFFKKIERHLSLERRHAKDVADWQVGFTR